MKEAALIIPLNPNQVYKFQDLSDCKFGRLTAKKVSGKDRHGRIYWSCECRCGKQKTARASHLRAGKISSCGCWHDEHTSLKNTIHGLSKKCPEYSVWKGIRQRCNNPSEKRYSDYGGRGISVCKEWNSFERFLTDMGKRPTKFHTIERVNNDGNYCPENCIWADRITQANNRRGVPFFEFNGEKLSMAQWSRKIGIPPHVLSGRIRIGWSVEKTLTTAIKKR